VINAAGMTRFSELSALWKRSHLEDNVNIHLAPLGHGCPDDAMSRNNGRTSFVGKSCLGSKGRVAVLFSESAHHNKRMSYDGFVSQSWDAAPRTKTELNGALATFARENIDTIVIDGGDGTVRDVLSLAKLHFGDAMPRFAIIPSGKTNAIATDLGIHGSWTAKNALPVLGSWRTVCRNPVEVRYGDETEPRLRGFIFGTSAFVSATRLAQAVHRAGAYNGLAVGLTLLGTLGRALFNWKNSDWRRGEAVTLELDGRIVHREAFVLLASTLERMPLGLRPFGRVRSGLKLLSVDAQPRMILLCALAAGLQYKWLSRLGCSRTDQSGFRLRLNGDFVLDGELFRGGDLSIAMGEPIEFLVPD
jgi:hypothetical protein